MNQLLEQPFLVLSGFSCGVKQKGMKYIHNDGSLHSSHRQTKFTSWPPFF